MPTIRPLSIVSASIALCAVSNVAFAQLRLPPRPILLPQPSSSSASSLESSATSSNASSVKTLKPGVKISQQYKLKNYCKDIAKLLKGAQSITPAAEKQAQFDMSVDMLTKANALCASMLAE